MTTILNEVRMSAYLDSVALMTIAQRLQALAGVEVAGLMIGTPANLQILREAGVLSSEGAAAGPGDIVIALRATSEAAAQAALAHARQLLDRPRAAAASSASWQPRTLHAALAQSPMANLALISVPGDFAVAEARKALHAGLHTMIFSDNVSIADEVSLKREARDLGLLVMGPDCGTAIIGGAPLAFANVVPRGDIGIIGASGTGIQEISCLIARAGRGVSHAIGTGGRDLKAEVGGITTLMAIDLFDADPATTHIVIVSKPPADEVAALILERVGRSPKPFTICFLGDGERAIPKNAHAVPVLEAAARSACGGGKPWVVTSQVPARRGAVRGLFAGGTLAAEAQIVLRGHNFAVASNAPVPGATRVGKVLEGHVMIDLGADEYTRGRPHPMIEPAVRDEALAAALADRRVAVVLLDCVLGFGGHMDPAGHLAAAVTAGRGKDGPLVIASVTGTDADPQNRQLQVAKLEAAGIVVAPSNAAAAELAASKVRSAG